MAENEPAKTDEKDDVTPAKSRAAARQPDQSPSESADAGEATYAVEDLVARSAGFLGQPPHVVAGALHGQTEDITLQDAKKRVRTFLENPATEEEE